jgi:hypothetical protein
MLLDFLQKPFNDKTTAFIKAYKAAYNEELQHLRLVPTMRFI